MLLYVYACVLPICALLMVLYPLLRRKTLPLARALRHSTVLSVLLLAAMLLGIVLLSDQIETEAPVIEIDPGAGDEPAVTIEYDGRLWEHKEYKYTTILRPHRQKHLYHPPYPFENFE